MTSRPISVCRWTPTPRGTLDGAVTERTPQELVLLLPQSPRLCTEYGVVMATKGNTEGQRI